MNVFDASSDEKRAVKPRDVKLTVEHYENSDGAHGIATEQVSGNENYPEHKGLSTNGDEDQELPMTFSRIMSLIAHAFNWTASQIPVYMFGGCPPKIYADIGGTDRWTWLVVGNLLALAAICPFVGSISDLLGRRYVALLGGIMLMVGSIICGLAKTMDVFIGGMVFNGMGAGILELTALAATSEMAPTRKRGLYVSGLLLSIIPFCPSVLWAQLIAAHSPSSWRWIAVICGSWAAMGFFLILLFYFPPPRVNSEGLSKAQILSQVDWVGGLLSTSGLILFMTALQWGGYQYPWRSAHVVTTLTLGIVIMAAFVVYEARFAKYPMFPKRLQKDPRVLGITMLITFISGMAFFSLLMFWPSQAYNVYGHDPLGVGLRGLPIGFSILLGACLGLVLLSVTRGKIRLQMVVATTLMTVGTGCMAFATRDNIKVVYFILFLAGLGVGGILVPASIISTIVCPEDLIATITALTLAIRVIGGSIGYAIYFNVFYNKFVPLATAKLAAAVVTSTGQVDPVLIREVIELTGASLIEKIAEIPAIQSVPGAWDAIVLAGQLAYAAAYKWVYYVSTVFGAVSVVAALFLGDIEKYMDSHVAVVIH